MKIFKISNREHGRTLLELGYKWKYIRIYRAVSSDVFEIKNMDYITLDKKFAIGHAEHMAVTEEYDQHVLSAMVKSELVAEALNPGEYFYIGKEDINGEVISVIKYE